MVSVQYYTDVIVVSWNFLLLFNCGVEEVCEHVRFVVNVLASDALE